MLKTKIIIESSGYRNNQIWVFLFEFLSYTKSTVHLQFLISLKIN